MTSFQFPAGAALALLVLGALPAAAQQLRVGLHAGASFSTLAGEGIDGLLYRRGLTAGVSLEQQTASAPIRLETGVSWIQKGTRGTLLGFEEPIPTNLRLDYLKVPFVLRVTPWPGAPLRSSLAIGSSFSLEIACDLEPAPDAVGQLVGCDDPVQARHRVDWSVLVGGGLAYDVGGAEVRVEGGYDLGLRDLDAGVERTNARSRGFTVTTRVSMPVP